MSTGTQSDRLISSSPRFKLSTDKHNAEDAKRQVTEHQSVQVTHDAPLKIAQEASSKDASTHQVSTVGLMGDQKKISVSACH
jgi:hypothetical protein